MSKPKDGRVGPDIARRRVESQPLAPIGDGENAEAEESERVPVRAPRPC